MNRASAPLELNSLRLGHSYNLWYMAMNPMTILSSAPPSGIADFWEMEFPEVKRNQVSDGLISACWHNVYSTMALLAYDFKRKAKDIISNAEYIFIDSAKETKTCEALVRKGLLGPELALRFQPAWRRYFCAIGQRGMFIWQCFLQKRFWTWS